MSQPTAERPPDDGALYACFECGARAAAAKMWWCRTPDGSTHMLCEPCVELEWLARAVKR